MSKKTLALLTAVLAASVLIYFSIVKYISRPKTKFPLERFESSDFRKIAVSGADAGYELYRKNNEWKISGYESYNINKSDRETINISLKAFEVKEIISDNPDKFDRFDVSPERGLWLAVFAGESVKPEVDIYL